MKKLTFALLCFCCSTMSQAREPYHANVAVDTTTASVSAPNLVDFSRELNTSAIEDLIPIYTPDSAVSFDFNFRGVLADASFAANSTALVVNIPQAGITETFDGGTRDNSITLFKDSMKDGGPRHRLLRAYSKYSPIDPIAGNPNSLQALMADADYALGSLYPFRGCGYCWDAQPSTHYFQAGLKFTRGFSEGYETSSATLPFRYSYSPCRTAAFIIDLPITYNKNGGASSLLGSGGIGLQIPITSNWTVTSVLRLGSGGSLDLATGSALASAGITSVCTLPLKSHVFAMTNYASYIASTNLWISGVNLNYHLHNFIFKNGISVTSCNRRFNYRLSFVDTCFTRDKLFIEHYDEVGAAIVIACVNPRLKYDCLSLGFAYQFGEQNYKGYSFDLIYQF